MRSKFSFVVLLVATIFVVVDASPLISRMRRYAEFAEYGDDADYWGNLDETDNVAQAKTDYGSTNIFSSLLSEAMKYRGDAGSTLKQLASSINKILRNFFDEGDTRRSRAFEESGPCSYIPETLTVDDSSILVYALCETINVLCNEYSAICHFQDQLHDIVLEGMVLRCDGIEGCGSQGRSVVRKIQELTTSIINIVNQVRGRPPRKPANPQTLGPESIFFTRTHDTARADEQLRIDKKSLATFILQFIQNFNSAPKQRPSNPQTFGPENIFFTRTLDTDSDLKDVYTSISQLIQATNELFGWVSLQNTSENFVNEMFLNIVVLVRRLWNLVEQTIPTNLQSAVPNFQRDIDIVYDFILSGKHSKQELFRETECLISRVLLYIQGKLPNDLDGCPHGTCYYGKGTTTIMEGVPEIIQLVLQQILRLIGSTGQIGTACQYQLTPRHIEYSPYPNYYPSYPVYPAGYLGYFGYPGYFAYPGWYQKPLYPMLPHGIPKPIEAPVDEPTKRPCPPAAPGAGGHRKDEGSSTSDTNEALDYGVPSPPVLDLSIAFDFQFSANVPSKDSGIKELYQTSDSSTLQSFLDLLKDLKMSTMTDPKTINKLLMLSIDSLDTIVSSDSEAIDHLLSDESDALFVNLIRTVGSIVARSLNLQLAGGVPDFFYYHDHEGVSGAEIDPLLDREKILEEITKLANLAISANFSVKQKREILFEIKDLIEIFIESEGSDRRFLIIKEINGEMISQGHLLWVSFVQFQIGALLQSYGLEVQLSPEARSTPIELISNFLINENFVMGPYAFHERYCNAISLMGITPGQPTFNQDDFNNFWTAYWKFMNSKGKQLLHPCGKYVVSSLPQALPDPNHVHRVVCPLAQLSLLDNSLATFDPKNWDRFAFAYWSWILTGGTMKPQLCYIRPPSATGVFNFFPLPGVHVGKSGDITVTPQVSLVQQMFPFPGFHGFQPMSPLQYRERFCLLVPLEAISPGSANFNQNLFNRFWRSYFNFLESAGSQVVRPCMRDATELQPDEPLLPLQVLPDPYKFYQEHCPGIEIASVALRSSHYHQFMRNYFNCLFDDQKCAINCLVDESRFDQEHDHFLPILGMTLREE